MLQCPNIVVEFVAGVWWKISQWKLAKEEQNSCSACSHHCATLWPRLILHLANNQQSLFARLKHDVVLYRIWLLFDFLGITSNERDPNWLRLCQNYRNETFFLSFFPLCPEMFFSRCGHIMMTYVKGDIHSTKKICINSHITKASMSVYVFQESSVY